jgi:hypothetical protein
MATEWFGAEEADERRPGVRQGIRLKRGREKPRQSETGRGKKVDKR